MSDKPNDETAARLLFLEAKLAELELLPVIAASRAAVTVDLRRISDAQRELDAKAAKRDADRLALDQHIGRDPLVRVVPTGGVGAFLIFDLEFAPEPYKLTGGRLSLAVEGTTAVNGNYLPHAWVGRSSDWNAIVAASGGQIEKALADGRLALHTYPTEATVGDAQLRRSWWHSGARTSTVKS